MRGSLRLSRDSTFYRRSLVARDRVRGRRRDLDCDRGRAVLGPLRERVPPAWRGRDAGRRASGREEPDHGRVRAREAAEPEASRIPQCVRGAVAAALAGKQFVSEDRDGGTYIAAVPYHGGALVAANRLGDVAEAIDIVNGEALRAGVIAGVIGVVVGLLLAQLIALRLRRLSAAAEAIAQGDFETPLRYRFRDEFGILAHNFDRMRRQLRRSFRRIEAERDRLRLLLERLHEGVLTIDQDLVVHFANAEARRLLGGRLREGDA